MHISITYGEKDNRFHGRKHSSFHSLYASIVETIRFRLAGLRNIDGNQVKRELSQAWGLSDSMFA